ncbi:MAG: EamA family transporter [Acidobacteriota bacterium]
MSTSTSSPTHRSIAASVTPLRLVLAFLSIYVIWGSTYLAIALLIETLPGFVMVGVRFVLAGLILGGIAWARGAPRPTAVEVRGASVIGVMLLFGGTGAVVWAADYLPSGLLAVLVAMEPLWIALLQWGGGRRPSLLTVLALGLGFLGAAVLAAPDDVLRGTPVHLPSVLAILVGSFSWAAGSLYSRRVALPASGAIVAAVQMLAGGGALLVFGLARGELRAFDPSGVSVTSVLAFLYLVTFGSLIAFSAYSWLIRVVEPTLVATHTYVNPAVAVFLGWWLADEIVGPRVLGATTLIIGSVILLTTQEARRARRRRRNASSKDVAQDSS